MHDDGAVIHEHPFALVEALDTRGFDAALLEEPFLDLLGDCIDTAIVRRRAYDEIVGDVEQVRYILDDDVGTLLLVDGPCGNKCLFPVCALLGQRAPFADVRFRLRQ